MTNVFDYLLWRGDLTLAQSPFDDVDGLIMTCLVYHYFDQVLTQYDGEAVAIAETARKIKALPGDKLHMRDPQDVVLLQLMGESRRYGEMGLCYYVDRTDVEQGEQFAAITILLGDGTAFVAYRGTDLALIGWKEDFNMSLLDCVPSQVAAAAYLQYVSQRLTEPLRIGGHSKGGNLAVYAASTCAKEVQERITMVYNHDGPGFRAGMLTSQGYLNILPKIHTFVPQSSVVGMLLEHDEDYIVVKSGQIGLLQHDPYSWEVRGREFICLESVTAGSKFMDRALRSWLEELVPEKREKFVEALFELLSMSHTDERGELVLAPKNVLRTLQALKNEDEETKEALNHGLKLLWQAVWKTAGGYGGAVSKIAEKKLLDMIK